MLYKYERMGDNFQLVGKGRLTGESDAGVATKIDQDGACLTRDLSGSGNYNYPDSLSVRKHEVRSDDEIMPPDQERTVSVQAPDEYLNLLARRAGALLEMCGFAGAGVEYVTRSDDYNMISWSELWVILAEREGDPGWTEERMRSLANSAQLIFALEKERSYASHDTKVVSPEDGDWDTLPTLPIEATLKRLFGETGSDIVEGEIVD